MIFGILIRLATSAAWATPVPLIHSIPWTTIPNQDTQYSLINSVHFHPSQNLFCAAYTQNNKICLYKITEDHQLELVQILCNPSARLKQPQHVVFSPDGNKMVVANWADLSLNVYLSTTGGKFSNTPATTYYLPHALRLSKPHGIAFSPCGNYFAVACGAASHFKNGIALYRCQKAHLECISVLNHQQLIGTPKGICFSNDGTHLLITFCLPNALRLFRIQNEKIYPLPIQTLEGSETGLSRPEDVKLSPDGMICAVSNSDQNTVTFYPFDSNAQLIVGNLPTFTLQNPDAQLAFPHGIDFSSDGSYLAITQFGAVTVDTQGDVFWPPTTSPETATINLYFVNCLPLERIQMLKKNKG